MKLNEYYQKYPQMFTVPRKEFSQLITLDDVRWLNKMGILI